MTADTDSRPRPIDPDALAELEEERAFLLRSLRDLEAEHAAGDVDEHDYATLRDGYTKRAADVLRRIEDGRAALPAKQPASWRRRAGLVAVVVATAAGAGLLVARSAGDRGSGDEITGGADIDDVPAMLAEARTLVFQSPQAASELYARVLELRPDDPEALTYSGVLLYQVGISSSDEEVVDSAVEGARENLERAIEVDPDYADPHCFLGVIALDQDGDEALARDEIDTCLELDPPAQIAAMGEAVLADLD